MERLIGILRRESELLEQLVHRATVLSMMIVAGEERFLVAASDDLTATATALGELEALRAVTCADVAEALGLPTDAPLLHLAERAEPATGHLLRSLGTRIARSMGEVDELLTSTDELAHAGIGTVRGTLERMATGAPSPVYGTVAAATTSPARFDHRA